MLNSGKMDVTKDAGLHTYVHRLPNLAGLLEAGEITRNATYFCMHRTQ
jgi:hypothetical protein